MEDKKQAPTDNREAKAEGMNPTTASDAIAGRTASTDSAARRHAHRARAYIVLVMVALAATLGAATYAWFTSNMKVKPIR